MKKPNWQSSFKNLPEIPNSKKWVENSRTTTEQDITFKIIKGEEINSTEKQVLINLLEFYENLEDEIKKLDYKSFDEEDFENFKNYIFYAFNYTPLISNNITIFKTYRLVVNEWIIGENKTIDHIKFLKYPSLDIVKKSNKYNRANTPNSNVLYTTENINTALLEIKPPLFKKLTVGVWKPNKDKKFVSYPISHSKEASKINESVSKATIAFENYSDEKNELLLNILRYYFTTLGYEYTKQVNFHYEYLISSLFSERILSNRNGENPDFNFDLIVYPSVGNQYKTVNFAIHADVVDNDFILESVAEFEIEEEHYDNDFTPPEPDIVTVAKITKLKFAKKILSDGTIEW